MSENKTALITGAGSGIGRALAVEASRLGFDLILVGRTQASLEQARALIGAGTVKLVVADVTTPKGRAAIADAAGGGLDIAINNAGTLTVSCFANVKDGDLARMVDTNLTAPILLTRDLLPAIPPQNSGCAGSQTPSGESCRAPALA
jgi:short-subunit dehydrogenase